MQSRICKTARRKPGKRKGEMIPTRNKKNGKPIYLHTYMMYICIYIYILDNICIVQLMDIGLSDLCAFGVVDGIARWHLMRLRLSPIIGHLQAGSFERTPRPNTFFEYK